MSLYCFIENHNDVLNYVFFCSTFKKKAPNGIKEIRKFAQKAMGTTDVRVDAYVKLNKLAHLESRDPKCAKEGSRTHCS